MNKQELIERIKKLDESYLKMELVLELVKQLEEPVKVPQFVAEIIEYYKRHNATLYDVLREKNFNKQYNEWLMNEQDAYNKVARAWLDGYEVEEEKWYLVSLKNGQPLVKTQSGNTFYFNQNITAGNYKVTRKQLEEADFGWVFDCEGVEVKEL